MNGYTWVYRTDMPSHNISLEVGIMEKKLREKILAAWENMDRAAVVEELMAAADTWKNGSIDGVLVFDTETEKLAVVKESASTHTPSFVYLFRLPGNGRPDVDEETLYLDLVEFDIETVLDC